MIQVRAERPLSRPLLLATVAMGGVLAPLNSTMLAVALPELRDAFSVGHVAIGWLVSSYLIAMAVAQPLGGRLGDQLGRARVFRLGLVAFLALSLAAALSPSFPVLVVMRTGQALVGAAVIPNGLAMLREALPTDRLGRSMGLTGSAMSFAAAVGPLVGTGLLAAGSWRLLFLVNVPLVLVALICQGFLRYPEPGGQRRVQLDWRGAIAFGAVLAALTLVLESLRGDGNWLVLAVSVLTFAALAALFFKTQRGTTMPVVAWDLFRSRSYVGATGYLLLTNLIMYTTLISIPFFIEEVQQKGSGTSGTLLGAMSILVAFIAPVGGRVSDWLGRQTPALVGGLIVICATAMLLIGMTDGVSYGYLAVALAVLGLGMGLGFGPATTAAIESASPQLAGSAAGSNSMMRYVGSIVGVGILSAVLGSAANPDVGLFRAIFAVLLGMSVLAGMTTLLVHHRPPSWGKEAGVVEQAVASPVGVSGS